MLQILDLMFRLIIVAVLLERGLSVLFEHRLFLRTLSGLGLEEVITLAGSVAVCRYGSFDLLAVLFRMAEPSLFGVFASAVIIVGFSKMSTKLFGEVLAIRSVALTEYKEGRLRTPMQSEEVSPRPSPESGEPADKPRARGAWLTKEIVTQIIKVAGAIAVAAVLAMLGLD